MVIFCLGNILKFILNDILSFSYLWNLTRQMSLFPKSLLWSGSNLAQEHGRALLSSSQRRPAKLPGASVDLQSRGLSLLGTSVPDAPQP